MSDKVVWGVAAGTHDGSLTVMKGNDILFASHSERFSRKKNDKDLHYYLIGEAMEYGYPEKIYWYENPLVKATRKLYAGQKDIWLSPKKYMERYGIFDSVVVWGDHHASHASAGYYTSHFTNACVLVVDAIGEWTTTSIWKGTNTDLKCLNRWKYPKSLGLFYSAFTDRVGLKANEDEYILMGMAAYGNPDRFYDEIMELSVLHDNFHRGIRWWKPELTEEDYFDVAAATQKVYEVYLKRILTTAKELTGEENLVFMGGCALNCLANRIIPDYFKSSWIMPNPGDAGSSLGAILAQTKERANWLTPYLGHNIEGEYPVDKVFKELIKTGMCGVANGRAEFGPRALGNRSLLADPRGIEMKDKVNTVKNRQEYRPFAPVIRQEDVRDHFKVGPHFTSPYMQYIVEAKEPEKYPAIVHQDGTSRVQTVTKLQHPGLYNLLTKWKEKTGCPMLLNTSLNIKGQPIVNTEENAKDFEKHYGVKVFTAK